MKELTNLTRPNVALPVNEQVGMERTNGGHGNLGSSHLGYSYEREEEQRSHLLDYWRIVRKHIWLIIGISILIPTLTALYLIRKPVIYESQARIQVDLENANPLLGGMSKNSSVILNSEKNDSAYFNTQLQILTGPGLLRKVVKNLDLEHNQSFLRDYPSTTKSRWSDLRTILGL